MPVVAEQAGVTAIEPMVWGLIPPYSQKGPAKLLPNAKVETVRQSPAFRQAFLERRCLVPANGFYEWRTEAGHKQPYFFELSNGEGFAFAGIWKPSAPQMPPTFSILTTVPNELVGTIHDRMPVILTGTDLPRWLGSGPIAAKTLERAARPYPASEMACRPVNRRVNSTRNDGPDCLSPPDLPREMDLDFGEG
jgi:putative SOS response-associated peptidase YedK